MEVTGSLPHAEPPLHAAVPAESRFRRVLSLLDAAAQEFDTLRRAGGGASLSHAERRVLALHYTPLERLAGDVLYPGPSEMVWASDDDTEAEGACDGSSLASSVVSISQSASRSSLSTSPVPDAAAAAAAAPAMCVCGKVELPKAFMEDYKRTGTALMSVDRLWGFLKAHGLPWRKLDREGAVVAVEKQIESETAFVEEHATAVAAAHAKSEIRAARERVAAQLARERAEAEAAAAKAGRAPPRSATAAATAATSPPAAAAVAGKTTPPPAKAVAAKAASKTAPAAARTASSARAVAAKVITAKVTSKITTVTAASDGSSTPRSASSSTSRTPRSASTPRMGAARRGNGGSTLTRANSIGATAGGSSTGNTGGTHGCTFGRRNTVRAAAAPTLAGGGGATNGASNANADGASAGSASGRLHISKATPVISTRPRPVGRERAATTVAVAAKPKPGALQRRHSEASLVRAKASLDMGPPLTRRSSEVLSRRPSAGAGNSKKV